MKNIPYLLKFWLRNAFLFLGLWCYNNDVAYAKAVPLSEKVEIQPREQVQPTKTKMRRVPAVFLAFLMPPLAVYFWLDKVVTPWFWWALILMLLGFVPGVLYAIFVVSR